MGLGIKSYIKRKLLVHRDKVVVFTFHQSSPIFNPQIHCAYTWSDIKQFENNLRFLKDNYRVVSLTRALGELREGSVKGTKIVLTFDDGDISVQNYIIPLLEKYEIPATFFINSAYSENYKGGYWFNVYNYLRNGNANQKRVITAEIESLYKKLRATEDKVFYEESYRIIEELVEHIDEPFDQYVSIEYLAKLNPKMFSIGLHGHEHKRFSMMSEEWQKDNLTSNIKRLSVLPGYIPVFAVPFGKAIDYNEMTLQICNDFGLEIAFSDRGYNINQGFGGIQRIPADGKDLKSLIKNILPKKYIKK